MWPSWREPKSSFGNYGVLLEGPSSVGSVHALTLFPQPLALGL